MMEKHLNTLKDIISLTVDINRALEDKPAELTTVRRLLEDRQKLTDLFTKQAAECVSDPEVALTDEISDILRQFERQQKLMQRQFEIHRSDSKEHLTQVVKHRKALQGYRISKTPDISYF